jgi:hypothetical protein
MRYILTLLLLLSSAVYAEDRAVTIDDINKLVEAIKSKPEKPQSPTLQTAAEAGSVAVNFGAEAGKALVSFAKELGVAAADFAKTDLGILVIVLIIFKIFGGPILGILFGLCFIITAILIGRHIINKIGCIREYTYDYKPVLWGLWNKRVIKSSSIPETNSEAIAGGYAVIIVGLVIGTIIVGVNISGI